MEDLFSNDAQAVFERYQQLKPGFFTSGQFDISDTASFFFYNGFEDLKSEKPFRGKGGFQSVKKGKNTLAEFAPGTFSAGKKYHVSVWMFNGFENALNMWFRFIIEEYDAEKNTWISTTGFPMQSETINGDWSLVEATFEVKDPRNKISIVTKGNDDSGNAFYADDILVKEEEVDVYKLNESKDTLFYNNHQVLLRH